MAAGPASTGLGWTVLALVFVDELLLVAAAVVAGWAGLGWPGGLTAGALAVAVWSTFASPRARRGGPIARPSAKTLITVGACGGCGGPVTSGEPRRCRS